MIGELFIMVNIKKLDNGVRVVLEEIDYVRSVSFGIWVRNGSRNEKPEYNGMSHFIEHMLFKGTENRTAKQKFIFLFKRYILRFCLSYKNSDTDCTTIVIIGIVQQMFYRKTNKNTATFNLDPRLFYSNFII